MSFFDISNDVPSVGQQQRQVSKSILQYFPQLAAMLNGQAGQQSQQNLDIQKTISGPTAALLQQLYETYAPKLAATGLKIGEQVQQGQAGANARVSNSAEGQAALNAAINADKTANKEYYDTRGLESKRLADLMNSIDLTGNLSGSETRAIGQSVARDNGRMGVDVAPSAINVASNAMQYGQAGYQRREQAKSDLSTAIGQATSFLPASQSKVDSWGVSTGGPTTATNMANASQGLFGGIQGGNKDNAQNASLMNTMLGGANSNANANTAGESSQATHLGTIAGMINA